MIEYKKGYKYQLYRAVQIRTRVLPVMPVEAFYAALDTTGLLSIGRGYAWDGASGPAIDGPTNMTASLVHDVLYQMMREGRLSDSMYRDVADLEYKRLCEEASVAYYSRLIRWRWLRAAVIAMAKVQATYSFAILQLFGRSASQAPGERKVHQAL